MGSKQMEHSSKLSTAITLHRFLLIHILLLQNLIYTILIEITGYDGLQVVSI